MCQYSIDLILVLCGDLLLLVQMCPSVLWLSVCVNVSVLCSLYSSIVWWSISVNISVLYWFHKQCCTVVCFSLKVCFWLLFSVFSRLTWLQKWWHKDLQSGNINLKLYLHQLKRLSLTLTPTPDFCWLWRGVLPHVNAWCSFAWHKNILNLLLKPLIFKSLHHFFFFVITPS